MYSHMINTHSSFSAKKIVSSLRSVLHQHRRAFLIGTVLMAVAAPPALASNLEEIVVTARKKAESLQDSPISITALSGERLEDMGFSFKRTNKK